MNATIAKNVSWLPDACERLPEFWLKVKVRLGLALTIVVFTATTADMSVGASAQSGSQQSTEPAPAKNAPSGAIVPDTKPIAQPAADSKQANQGKTASGRVVDEKGNPIAGAELFMAPKLGYNRTERWKLRGVADTAGRFVLRVPDQWLEPQTILPDWIVWAYAPGRQLNATSAYGLISLGSADDLQIVLGPATDTSFVVLDPEGNPVPGAVVEPWHMKVGPYHIVPEDLSRLVRGMTDNSGRAQLFAVQRKGFLTVQVRGPRVRFPTFGTQQVRLDASGDTPAERTIRLRPTGRVEGRLVGDTPEYVRGVWLAVMSGEYTEGGSDIPRGYAEVVTDDEGRFVVPETVAGPLDISFAVNSQWPVRPRVPKQLLVVAGDTTHVEVPLVPAVQVRGEVKTKQTGAAVAGAIVSIGHEHAKSDAQGKFQVYVLPGPTSTQTIAVPNGYLHLTPLTRQMEVTVPATKEAFDLPPLEVAQAETIQGRLVNPHDEPIVGAVVLTRADGRYYGYRAKTEKDGRFKLMIPVGMEIEYLIRRPETPESTNANGTSAEIVKRDPLLLRAALP